MFGSYQCVRELLLTTAHIHSKVRPRRVRLFGVNDDDCVQSEWDELIKAEESLKESWGKMLQAKRDTWISLKESGKLQQLHVDDDEGIDEDLLDEDLLDE